jgi:hypothetical protein
MKKQLYIYVYVGMLCVSIRIVEYTVLYVYDQYAFCEYTFCEYTFRKYVL